MHGHFRWDQQEKDNAAKTKGTGGTGRRPAGKAAANPKTAPQKKTTAKPKRKAPLDSDLEEDEGPQSKSGRRQNVEVYANQQTIGDFVVPGTVLEYVFFSF